jgi:hypothetical protein
MLCIAFIVESQAEKDWMWDVRGILKGKGIYDEIDPKDWIYPVTNQRCSLIGGCCDYGGSEGEQREYSIRAFRLPDRDTILAGPKTLMVKPMHQEQKRRVIHVYRLIAGEEPEPEKPPPGDDRAKAIARATADFARGQAAALALFATEMDGLAGE